jgi:hypothetical protein
MTFAYGGTVSLDSRESERTALQRKDLTTDGCGFSIA